MRGDKLGHLRNTGAAGMHDAGNVPAIDLTADSLDHTPDILVGQHGENRKCTTMTWGLPQIVG
ncbi:MAG TPA: hypothetical protein VD885_02060, partial [Methylophilaceae bacterium]|nr:hypothetical protein [Methylophilaceae bacterium]